jgi:hypothetical protein
MAMRNIGTAFAGPTCPFRYDYIATADIKSACNHRLNRKKMQVNAQSIINDADFTIVIIGYSRSNAGFGIIRQMLRIDFGDDARQ